MIPAASQPDQDFIHIRKINAGDVGAFRKLVEAHQSRVRGFLRRLCGSSDHSRADDLAQEVFLQAFKGLNSFRFESSFSTWLHSISYRVYVDDVRKYSKQRELDAVAFVEEDGQSGITELGRIDLQQDLALALEGLKLEERSAILLTSIEELTHEETALAMNAPLGSVKSWVSRGKTHLKEALVAKGWNEVTL